MVIAKRFAACLLAIGLAGTDAGAQNLPNLNLSAAVDLVGPFSLDTAEGNRLGVRSAEVLLYAPVDHLFDAVLNVAGHEDQGEFRFDVHEAFAGSSRLIPRSRFKLGKFLLGVGRLNQFHQHDWPFVTAPKVHREFFNPGAGTLNAESTADTGVEYSWLLPTESFIELTAGVTGGYCYGHCHTTGKRPPRPLYYLHPTYFMDWGASEGVLAGLSYLSRQSDTQIKTDVIGFDLTYKRRDGRRLAWLWQGEGYWQRQRAPGAAAATKVGAYVYGQYGIDEQLQFGLRVDLFSRLDLKFESNGGDRRDLDYAIVPTVSYRPSEFSVLRLAYSHEVDTTQGTGDVRDRQVQFQFVYSLGAHPAHDF